MLIVIDRGGASSAAHAETGFSGGYQPGDVRQISRGSIDNKLRVRKNVVGPQGSIADVVDRVVGEKYVARAAFRRSINLPAQARSVEQVGQGLKIETWKRLWQDASSNARWELSDAIGVASPDLSLAVNLKGVV